MNYSSIKSGAYSPQPTEDFAMKRFKVLCALGCLFGLHAVRAADDDFSKEVIKATPLSSSIYMRLKALAAT